MTYIDPETLKIQLYSFVTSSYLPFHEHVLLLEVQVSSWLWRFTVWGCFLNMAMLAISPQGEAIPTGTAWIVAQSGQERRERRKGTERWGKSQWGWSGSVLKSGQQGFYHELPHLEACSMSCLRSSFHNCKSTETQYSIMARAQACGDDSSSGFKWISAFYPSWECERPQQSCRTCGMTKGSFDITAEAQPC